MHSDFIDRSDAGRQLAVAVARLELVDSGVLARRGNPNWPSRR